NELDDNPAIEVSDTILKSNTIQTPSAQDSTNTSQLDTSIEFASDESIDVALQTSIKQDERAALNYNVADIVSDSKLQNTLASEDVTLENINDELNILLFKLKTDIRRLLSRYKIKRGKITLNVFFAHGEIYKATSDVKLSKFNDELNKLLLNKVINNTVFSGEIKHDIIAK
ncbi:hypothetical protein, partial [Vibrio parahaemolyticus]|uniref:hypothetical protein n=1 Tax=Vibrio parahaemolyticus TaxID=670 RepID=UPI00116B2440